MNVSVKARKIAPKNKNALAPLFSSRHVEAAEYVLLTGSEDYFAEDAVSTLKQKMSRESNIEYHTIDASQYVSGMLFDFASPSLFGEPRLIVIDSFEKTNDACVKDLMTLSGHQTTDLCVVIRHRSGVKAKKCLDTLRSLHGKTVEVECLPVKRENERTLFVQGFFNETDQKISRSAIQALLDIFPENLAELSAACRQLLSSNDTRFSDELVFQLFGSKIHVGVFQLVDIALAGRHTDAQVALKRSIDSGAEPIALVGAFASKIRTIALVHSARGKAADIAKNLAMAPWQAERALRDARSWSESGIERCLRELARVDYQLKTSRGNSTHAISELVSLVCLRGQ